MTDIGKVGQAEPTQLQLDIAFWLAVSKEFIDGHDEGDEGIIKYALQYLCLSMTQAQMDQDPNRH